MHLNSIQLNFSWCYSTRKGLWDQYYQRIFIIVFPILGGNLVREGKGFLGITLGRFRSSKSSVSSIPQNLGWSLHITLWRNQSNVSLSSSSNPSKKTTSSLTPRGGNINDSLSDCPVKTLKGPNPNPSWEITFVQAVGSHFAWKLHYQGSDYFLSNLYCFIRFTTSSWESNLGLSCLFRCHFAPSRMPIFSCVFLLIPVVGEWVTSY